MGKDTTLAWFHQIHSDISLPTDPKLMERVLSSEQILAIAEKIWTEELNRLVAVQHWNIPSNVPWNHPLYREAAKRERHDLWVVRGAIAEVLGMVGKNIWITGFASDFAIGLLKYVSGNVWHAGETNQNVSKILRWDNISPQT